MQNKINKIAISTLLTLFFVSEVYSGAWTQAHRGGFFQFDYSFKYARNTLIDEGSISQFRADLITQTLTTYIEYGLGPKITFIARLPFLEQKIRSSATIPSNGELLQPGSRLSFSDIDLGPKFLLFQGNSVVISGGFLLGFPTGTSGDLGLNFTDGEFNQLINLELGFSRKKWWISTRVGLNNRTKGYSEEFHFEGEFGVKLFKDHVLFGLKTLGTISLKNGEPNNNSFITPLAYIAYEHKGKVGFVLQGAAAQDITLPNLETIPTYSFNIYYKLAGN